MTKARLKTFVTRPERRPVSMRGFALSENRDSDVQVANLSYGGCQIRSGDAFKAGEVVELRIIKHGAIDAEIRWTGEGRAGASFLN
jgi:PilZ domain-containing protein